MFLNARDRRHDVKKRQGSRIEKQSRHRTSPVVDARKRKAQSCLWTSSNVYKQSGLPVTSLRASRYVRELFLFCHREMHLRKRRSGYDVTPCARAYASLFGRNVSAHALYLEVPDEQMWAEQESRDEGQFLNLKRATSALYMCQWRKRTRCLVCIISPFVRETYRVLR